MRGDRAFAWVAFGVAVLLLASPLKVFWARAGAGWITPFIIWGVFIGVSAWLVRSRGQGGE